MPLATQSSAENAGGRWQRVSDGQEGATTATIFGRCRPSASRARTTGNYTPSPPGPTNCVTWRSSSAASARGRSCRVRMSASDISATGKSGICG